MLDVYKPEKVVTRPQVMMFDGRVGARDSGIAALKQMRLTSMRHTANQNRIRWHCHSHHNHQATRPDLQQMLVHGASCFAAWRAVQHSMVCSCFDNEHDPAIALLPQPGNNKPLMKR
jgi:hypothetical protein